MKHLYKYRGYTFTTEQMPTGKIQTTLPGWTDRPREFETEGAAIERHKEIIGTHLAAVSIEDVPEFQDRILYDLGMIL